MAQVAFSIRMDEDLKRDFSAFCDDVGMSMSTAFVIFAKETLREQQIPFGVGRLPRTPSRTMRRESESERIARKAKEAFEDIRADVQARGLPEMTMEEIDAEIAAARRERREREANARKVSCL